VPDDGTPFASEQSTVTMALQRKRGTRPASFLLASLAYRPKYESDPQDRRRGSDFGGPILSGSRLDARLGGLTSSSNCLRRNPLVNGGLSAFPFLDHSECRGLSVRELMKRVSDSAPRVLSRKHEILVD